MKEVLQGLWKIPLKGRARVTETNAFLIVRGDETVLIDAGTPGPIQVDAIMETVRRANGTGRIDHILVTHYHADHVGSLAEVAAASGAKVWAPQGDVHIIKGGGRPPDMEQTGLLGWLLARVIHMHEQEGKPVDEIVTGGQRLDLAGGIQVIDTPGHTGGHVCFLWQEHGGVLFLGDAAGNLVGLSTFPLNEDARRAEKSFVELSGRVFEAAMFGHGRPILTGASDRFKKAARRFT